MIKQYFFKLFDEIGMSYLRKRSKVLTAYLEALLIKAFENDPEVSFSNITPIDPEQRGSQLSLRFTSNVHDVHSELEKRGVIVSLFQFIIN